MTRSLERRASLEGDLVRGSGPGALVRDFEWELNDTSLPQALPAFSQQ